MKILVVGNERIFEEFKEKFVQGQPEASHDYKFLAQEEIREEYLRSASLVFDFTLDDEPENIEKYLSFEQLTVFCNLSRMSLAEIKYYNPEIDCTLVRFNGLPTFINRPLLELSLMKQEDEAKVARICQTLGTDYALVADRVGMATPRVICMIINEAYYTLQEGTASREDIDLGMKLGTNYPYGPFEWCRRIGVKHVYELLEAVYEDTKDERYKICPLLKREYLQAE
jgi:3-hydroxybutyryl-CoA dehydrogenase